MMDQSELLRRPTKTVTKCSMSLWPTNKDTFTHPIYYETCRFSLVPAPAKGLSMRLPI